MSLENEIIGVAHLGILTGDLKRDVAWYEEKLGFEKIQQRIVVMNGRTEIALLKKENLVLERWSFRNFPSARFRFLSRYFSITPVFTMSL